MPGVAASNRSDAGARLRRFLALLVLGALLGAVPLADLSPSGARRDDGRRAGLDRAHTFALLDSAATTPHAPDRHDAPPGTLPSLPAFALVALAGASIVRVRRTPSPNPRVGFRRRAPPLLRIAS